jgi:hypothetical protein
MTRDTQILEESRDRKREERSGHSGITSVDSPKEKPRPFLPFDPRLLHLAPSSRSSSARALQRSFAQIAPLSPTSLFFPQPLRLTPRPRPRPLPHLLDYLPSYLVAHLIPPHLVAHLANRLLGILVGNPPEILPVSPARSPARTPHGLPRSLTSWL